LRCCKDIYGHSQTEWNFHTNYVARHFTISMKLTSSYGILLFPAPRQEMLRSVCPSVCLSVCPISHTLGACTIVRAPSNCHRDRRCISFRRAILCSSRLITRESRLITALKRNHVITRCSKNIPYYNTIIISLAYTHTVRDHIIMTVFSRGNI